MKKPEPDIREKLYEQVESELGRVVDVVMDGRKPKNTRAELLRATLKLAYQNGLDRGYDLGFVVFGDGSSSDDDSDDDDSDNEPVDVNDDGEPT